MSRLEADRLTDEPEQRLADAIGSCLRGMDIAIAANNPDPEERNAALNRLRDSKMGEERIQQLIQRKKFAHTLILRKQRPR